MAEVVTPPRVLVLAGTNGAGKSTIMGAWLEQHGAVFFNPDRFAAELRAEDQALSAAEASSIGWSTGVRLLREAIDQRHDFNLETTLGGRTITQLLDRALDEGLEVRILYTGLESIELHLRRVRRRVERGGHDVPEDRVRERFRASPRNLAHLAPRLTELRVFDNSAEADPAAGEVPAPRLLLHAKEGRIIDCCPADSRPAWAGPLFAAFARK